MISALLIQILGDMAIDTLGTRVHSNFSTVELPHLDLDLLAAIAQRAVSRALVEMYIQEGMLTSIEEGGKEYLVYDPAMFNVGVNIFECK